MMDKIDLISSMTNDDIMGAIGVLSTYECVLEDPMAFEAGELPVPWAKWDEGGDTYLCVFRTHMPYVYKLYCEKNGIETDWETIKASLDRLYLILDQRINNEMDQDCDERWSELEIY